jgi:starvation-inducible outer membrane lipoprotein
MEIKMKKNTLSGLALLGLMVTAALGLTGCASDPQRTEATSNKDIKYDVLFERHGCEFGRFNDGGHYVYTTICPNGSAQTEYTRPQGKATVQEQSLMTLSPRF